MQGILKRRDFDEYLFAKTTLEDQNPLSLMFLHDMRAKEATEAAYFLSS